MESHQPPKAREVEQEEDGAFKGNLGRTQTDHVLVTAADGSVRPIEVYRVVNVATHPELKDRVFSGALHRLQDGRELALCFVYHDPKAQKFALVIPEVLTHLELKERAKLINALSEDSSHQVPSYVRECTTIIGIVALEIYLADRLLPSNSDLSKLSAKQKERHLKDVERELTRRNRALCEGERRLATTTRTIEAREKSILSREQQLEVRKRDLSRREQRLEEQLGRLARETSYHPSVSDGEWREISSFPPPSIEVKRVQLEEFANGAAESSLERIVRDGEYVEIDSPQEPAREQERNTNRARSRTSGPPPLRLRAGVSPPPLTRRGDSDRAYEYSDGRLISEVPAPSASDVAPPPLPVSLSKESRTRTVRDSDLITVNKPEVEPPPHFLASEDLQIAIVLDKHLWLFVRVEDVHIYSYRRSLDLLIQYCEYHNYPMVFLSLVTERKEEFWIRRALLDPYREKDREIVEELARSFSAHVVLYVGGEYLQTIKVASPRETIAEEILRRSSVQSEPAESNISSADARELAFEEPPPVYSEDLPFYRRRRANTSLAQVATAVEQLSVWMQPDKMRQALFTYSIPRQSIDSSAKRLLSEAIKFGIALPEELRNQAVALGLATSEAELIDKQIHHFTARLEETGAEFGREAIAKNWRELLDAADRLELEVDEAIRRIAIRSRLPASATTADVARYYSLSTEQLLNRLKQTEIDLEVVRELCRRRDATVLSEVFALFRRMRSDDLFRVMAHIVQFGHGAIDALLDALSSDLVDLRHGATLALGRIKSQSAIDPLIRQLQSEKTNIWSEIARSIGDYGKEILKPLSHALQISEGADQRFVLTLAHLANNGCSQQIGKLEKDANGRIASAARKATAQYSRVKWEDQSIRENRPLNNPSQTLRSSQLFFAELAEIERKRK
ncbi:MAG: hypothetical protein JXA30_10025 [Deltaproteobacteria bacterium]|nr:hypothetical protein [Deltaproteobacteria bacterium]